MAKEEPIVVVKEVGKNLWNSGGAERRFFRCGTGRNLWADRGTVMVPVRVPYSVF